MSRFVKGQRILSISENTMILSVDLEKLKKESVLELYEDKHKFALIGSAMGLKVSSLRMKPLAVAFAKHTYTRGAVVYSQHEAADALVLLTNGEVELVSRKKDQPTKERLGSKYRLRNQLSPFLTKGNSRVAPVCLVSAGQLLAEETVLKLPRHLCEAVVVSEAATAYHIKKEHLDRLSSLLNEEGLLLRFIESCQRKVELLEARLRKVEQPSVAVSAMHMSNTPGGLAPKEPSQATIRFNFKQPREKTHELSAEVKFRLKTIVMRSAELHEPKILRPYAEPRRASKARLSIDKSLQWEANKKQASILASVSRKDSGVLSPSVSKYPEKSSMSTFSASKSAKHNRSLQELFRIAKQPIAEQLDFGPQHSPLLSTGRIVLLDKAASPHTKKKKLEGFCLH